MIEFACEHCRRPVRVDDAHRGKKGRCPHCKEVVSIPARPASLDDLTAALESQLGDDSTLGAVPPPPAVGAAATDDDLLMQKADDALADTVILPAEEIARVETSPLDHYHLRPLIRRPPAASGRRTFLVAAVALVVLTAAALAVYILLQMGR